MYFRSDPSFNHDYRGENPCVWIGRYNPYDPTNPTPPASPARRLSWKPLLGLRIEAIAFRSGFPYYDS